SNESKKKEKDSNGLVVLDESFEEKGEDLSEIHVNASANGIEEVSDCVMVLDDDCKETESGVSGMDGDNELVDYVRCDEAKLEVSDMGYVECCEENVNVRGNGIECVNLIALDELCGGKVEGIEIELDDLVDSNAVSTCRVVTDNFAKRDNVLEERNKRVGLSSLIYGGVRLLKVQRAMRGMKSM
ncbi:hypothetical protein Tco_1545515, partial [Tanacetum coccineum]